MFTGLERTAIASPAPSNLARWYVDRLGFAINFQYAGNFFVKAPNGAMLEIIPAEGDAPAPAMRTPGLRDLRVSVAEFELAYERLQQLDVHSLAAPFETQGNRLVFFTDCDGNLRHLIQRPKPLP